MVHMAFRASNVNFFNLMQRCSRLRTIQIPHSYQKTMSEAIQPFLDMQGIELLEGDVWGHRKTLDEYYTVEGLNHRGDARLQPMAQPLMM